MNIEKYVEMYKRDLYLKNYCTNSVNNYSSHIHSFLSHFNNVVTKPSEISESKIKDWLLLSDSVNSRRTRLSALKLFYSLTGKQPMKLKYIEYPRSEKKLPIVLAQDEIQKMFDVCTNLKHKVILALLYSCGLRVSELINLKWSHLDRNRKIINIIQGKGKKDRQVPFPDVIIPILEKYYREYKSVDYILNGQNDSPQYSKESVLQVIKQLANKSKIKKHVYTHLIRHCTFTHQVENGIDINLIQKLAGHANVKTTMIYTHISDKTISKIKSPINNIKL